MRRFFKTVMACAMLGLLSGAPLSGAHGTAATGVMLAPQQNPFAGDWFGPFVNLDTGEGGVMDLLIAANGRLTGCFLWDNGDFGEFVGTVRPNGQLHVAAPGGGGGYHGIATIDIDGDMLIDAWDNDSGSPYAVTLSLQ